MLHPAPRTSEQLKPSHFDVDTVASAIKTAREQADVGFGDLPNFDNRSVIKDKEKLQETPAAQLDASKGFDSPLASVASEATPISDETSAAAQASVGFDLPDFKDRGAILADKYHQERASEIPAANLDASIGDPSGDPQVAEVSTTEPAVKNSERLHPVSHRADIEAKTIAHEEVGNSQSDKKSLVDRAKEVLFTKTDRLLLEERLAKEQYQPKHRLDRDETTYEQPLEQSGEQEQASVGSSDAEQDQQLERPSPQHKAEANDDADDYYEQDWIDRASDAINGKLTKLYYGIGNVMNKFSSNARKDGETDDEYSERMERNGRRTALGITAVTAAYGLYRVYNLYHGLSSSSHVDITTLSTKEVMEKIENANGPSGVYPHPSSIPEAIGVDLPGTADHAGNMPSSGVGDVISNSDVGGGYLPVESGQSSAGNSSDAWNIPSGRGGEAFMDRLGVDKGVWYEHQDEFLSKFPKEAYRMSDGNVGFSNTGRLSKDAIEFWSKYANK